ncbi:hypothetical protein K435DRAFT_764000 [Dendrothele bispora CBS 962.96]|uniref:Metaxin glutathione S-transferase domain-containing protein n=1 Tax=Dendrothele bispora (strain CBS 962.96) TaxID=1314807 RepID=A0A4V4HD29_DENBC|nr:hypothetical protein K435DRAFT_764000 [Dendrothele bispora CBS 962.96]
MQVPAFFKKISASFPLYTYSPVHSLSTTTPKEPTLWIHPCNEADALSGDVECLKWQAYLALRGLNNIRVRTDIHPQGAIDRRLPNLHLPDDRLLPAHSIPEWVDEYLAHSSLDDRWEGYASEAAKDESRAWVALLEGNVHAALILAQNPPSLKNNLLEMLSPFPTFTSESSALNSLRSTVVPPPPPATGFLSLLPPIGIRVDAESVNAKYAQAIQALSERLSTDKWFLGSENPTPLDALVFAYLNCILRSPEPIRTQVTRRVNLVAWEWRVRGIVRNAFAKSNNVPT